MHKSIVSFGVGGGDTKGKGSIMVVSTNNPRPTFNNGEASMLSTMVLTTGITFMCLVIPCGSMVLIIGITLAGAISPCGSMVLIVGITLEVSLTLADHDKSVYQPS